MEKEKEYDIKNSMMKYEVYEKCVAIVALYEYGMRGL